ncbi:MAG: hypothetical protein ABII22_03480 [Candidatus Micrarchaeota archaeon]
MDQSEVVTAEVLPSQKMNEVVVFGKGYLSGLKKEVLGSAEALSGSGNIVLRKIGSLAGGAIHATDFSSRLESKASSRITANIYINKLRLEMAVPKSEWRKFVNGSKDLQETILDVYDIRVAESLIQKCTTDLDQHVGLSKEEVECFIKTVLFCSSYEKMADRLLEHIFNISDQSSPNVLWGFYNKGLLRGDRMIEHIVLRGENFLNLLSQYLSSLKVANKQMVVDKFRSKILVGEPLISVIRDLQFNSGLPSEMVQDLNEIISKNIHNAKMLEVGPLLLMEYEKGYRPVDDNVGITKSVSDTFWGVYSKFRRKMMKRRYSANSNTNQSLFYDWKESEAPDVKTVPIDPIETEDVDKRVVYPSDPGEAPMHKDAESLGFDIDSILMPAGYSLAPNANERDLKQYFDGLPPPSQFTMSKYYMALQRAKSDGFVIRA